MSQALSPATSLENGEEATPRRLGRSYVACTRCHDHKIKCSGETPKCRNCQRAKEIQECVYPFRDRKLSVPESQMRRLEAENRELEAKIRELKRKRPSEPGPYVSPPITTDINETPAPTANASESCGSNTEIHFEEDCSFENDETFIEPNYIGEAACTTFGKRLHKYLTGDDGQWPPRRPHYYRNHRLQRLSNPDYKLPNKNYAQLLVMVVIRFIGPDYHLILRKSFMERLDETYRLNNCTDYTWLCRLFVVFALGELYSQGASQNKSGHSVPGTAYFMKAMTLFEDLYEEPTIDYIETLLLIAFYSLALNRIIPAYTYTGLALRLSLTLGLHRRTPDNRAMMSWEREHRIRVWWTVYNLDRVCSSKIGLPIMLRDEDVDVPFPSMDNLTEEEKEDFHDPSHIIAQHKLAKTTGEILNEIYRIPQPGRAKKFPLSAHKILTSLQSWQETLPPVLKFNQRTIPMYSSRSVASLHLNYSQCVILTTRPIFFPCLRAYHEASKKRQRPRQLSDLVEGLSEACVNAARTSSSIIAQLWTNGDLATFGFFDALSIFSSTLILMMSSTMNYKAHDGDHDKVVTSLSLLKGMRDGGNIPAHNYYDQLVQLKHDLDQAADEVRGSFAVLQNDHDQNSGLPALVAPNNHEFGYNNQGINGVLDEGQNFGAFGNFDTREVLSGHYIQNFLNQQQPYTQSLTDAIPSFPTDDFSGHFDFDFLDMNEQDAVGMF